MRFREEDILIRNPKSEGKVVWISQRLVAEVCEIDDAYFESKARYRYKSSVQPCHRNRSVLPDTGKSWRWAKAKGGFYYDLKRIPNRKPTYYRDLFGDAEELVRKYNEAMESESRSMFAAEFKRYINQNYKGYLCCYTEGCNYNQQVALAKAATAVEFAVKYMMDNEAKAPAVCRMVAEQVEQADMMYLPKHYRRLQEKVEAVVEGNQAVDEVIYLPRAGNTSALKYDDKQVLAWVVQMRAMGENYSNAHIIRKVQAACRITGKPVPSDRWFGMTILETNKVKFLTASGRYGSGSRRAQLYEGYVPVAGALFAGDCWQVDATRMNLISHKAEDGKKFLYIVAVRDVHSGDLLGYSFDYSENRWVYQRALKMAVDDAGYLPWELVVDRFPGHNTQEFDDIFFRMESMGVKVTKTHKATGKSHLERCFGTLQSVFMMEHPLYYGEGIKSTRGNAHRSPEYLKQAEKDAKAEGWDLTSAYQACVDIVEEYRNTKLSEYSRKHKNVEQSPREIHRWSDKPHVVEVTEEQAMMLLGMHKEVRVKNNGRIVTEINKLEYIYTVADYGVIANEGSVVMAYDTEDPEKVELYKRDGRLLVHLCAAGLFERPQIYGPDAEHGKVSKEQKRLREIQERKADELEAMTSAAGDEAELLRGKFTIKGKAEEAESSLIEDELRQAVGSPYGEQPSRLRAVKGQEEDDEIDADSLVDGNY